MSAAVSFDMREVKLLAKPLQGATHEGVFEGYASLFDVADLGKDVVAPGAFAQSLRRRGAVGDAHALAARSGRTDRPLAVHHGGRPRPSRARPPQPRGGTGARNPRADARRRGRRPVDRLSRRARQPRARAGLRRLEKLDLWEISLVTFPMLPGARVGAVKGRGGGCRARATAQFLPVMAGLAPAIHVLSAQRRKAWIPGPSPGMTVVVRPHRRHGRPCAGHPRLCSAAPEGVDPRAEPGDDGCGGLAIEKLVQIIPSRIEAVDQAHLPGSRPVFHRLLTLDGVADVLEAFVVDELDEGRIAS